MTQPIDVTIVHGTGACGAPWTRHGSALRGALREGLPEQSRVRCFAWSGSNTHRTRLAGATRLAEVLDQRIAADPSRRQALVAHSHGANVAMYALRQMEYAGRVESVICLASPFIHVRRWRGGRVATRVLIGLPCAIAGAVVGRSAFRGTEALTTAAGIHDGSMPIWLEGLAGLFGAGIFALVTVILFRMCTGWMRRRSMAFRQAMRVGGTDTPGILAIRFSGDEASMWLRIGHWLTDVPVRIWNTGIGWVGSFAITVGVLAWIRRGSMSGQDLEAEEIRGLFRSVLLSGEAGGLPLIVVVVGVALLWVVLAWSVRRLATGGLFGFVPWGASLGVSVSVQDRPQGQWASVDFRKLKPDTRRPAMRKRDMKHCRVYERPEVLEMVVERLRG